MKFSGFGVVFILVLLVTLAYAGDEKRRLEEGDLQVEDIENDNQPLEEITQDENQIQTEDTQSVETQSQEEVETEVSEKEEVSEEKSNPKNQRGPTKKTKQSAPEQNDEETGKDQNEVASEEGETQSNESENVPVEEETPIKESVNSVKVPENNQQNEGTTEVAKESEQENPSNKPNEEQTEEKKQQESSGYFQMSLSVVVLLFSGVFAFFVGFYRYSLNKYRIAPFSPPSFCPNFLFPKPESSTILDDYYNHDLEMSNGFSNQKYHTLI